MTNPQPTSPVTSPRTSTTAGVFSQVRTATDNRLNHTVAGHNRIPNLIASGRAAKPQASISNDMVAAIEAYQPKPGRQMARSMNLDVQNTPPPQVDNVIDAIQRYLDIKPRREPTADPKAEASVARHPQQIIQSAQRWDDAMRYQFASNGVENYQFRPEYRAWAGGLDLTIENEGSADISAPPTRSPMSGSPLTSLSALGENVVHDPVDAAQSAMGQMIETQTPAPEIKTFGPPIMTDNPYFDPSYAAQNAAAKIRSDLGVNENTGLKVGPGNYIDDPSNNPASVIQNTMARTKDALRDSKKEFMTVGQGNITDDPAKDPAYNYQNTASEMRQRLNQPKRDFITVGQSNFTDDPAKDPAYNYQNTASEMRQLLDRPERDFVTVGHPNRVDDPDKDPVYIAENITAENLEYLNRERMAQVLVGVANMTDNIYDQPRQAWYSSTQVAAGLTQQGGINLDSASSFRPLADNDAYIRAIRIIDGMNRIQFSTPIVGSKA